MFKFAKVFALLSVALLLAGTDARRVRIRPQRPVAEEEPADQEEQPQRVEYYAAESQESQEPQQKLVLLTNEGEVLNGLYGRAIERAGTEAQYPRVLQRPGLVAQPRPTRVKEAAKEPPVQTIRNYSKVNDDGSFTFGYEAADGSFKEETRGTDCVVRGKYGYIDPDGNKREFTYVSGNPCDPNAPQDEEKDDSEESGEENVPQNIPKRPLRPLRPVGKPVVARPATTLFQQDFNTVHGENAVAPEDDAQPPQPTLYFHPTPAPAPAPVASPVPVPVPAAVPAAVPAPSPARVRGRVPNRPVPVQLPVPSEKPETVVRVTPRPVTPPTPATLPATTYRPQLLVSVTPRPNVVLTKHQSTPVAPSPSPISSLNFDEELKRFQLENNVVTTPKTLSPSTTHKAEHPVVPSGQPVYTSELVFDPATGQYNTVLYQQIPKSTADITLKTRLPQLVPQPQPQLPPQPQRANPLRQHPSNLLQQQIFEQQKQVLFQQSQDLYNQQRNQLQAQQHRFQPTFTPTTLQYQTLPSTVAPAAAKPLATGPQKFETPEPAHRVLSRPISPQQFYYFAPQIDAQTQSIAAGQIDAFLRGHNYQF